MKEITLNGSRLLLVEVPEGKVIICGIDKGDALYSLEVIVNNEEDFYLFPPGDWDFLFASPLRPTEEEAAGVVEYYGNGMYRDYDLPRLFGYKTLATDSWESFVTSHGFTPGRVVGMIDRKK